jgi:hypothetical protein
MTACEALFWIGLGVLKTTKELSDETTAFLERWTYLPADSVLRALEGRVATDPYCAIATFVLDGGPEISYGYGLRRGVGREGTFPIVNSRHSWPKNSPPKHAIRLNSNWQRLSY